MTNEAIKILDLAKRKTVGQGVYYAEDGHEMPHRAEWMALWHAKVYLDQGEAAYRRHIALEGHATVALLNQIEGGRR